MATDTRRAVAAERVLTGVDDRGRTEAIRLRIEWMTGGVWGVIRTVNVQLRENPELTREDDVVFRGYELDDAIAAANGVLSDDLAVSCSDGIMVAPGPPMFARRELERPLERWFLR